ncbi:MAG: HAD family hydrolase [Acidobacteriota bacterium]
MKALLFDFGGTIDTGGIHWFEKFWNLYSSIGIVIDRTVFRDAFKYSEQQMSRIDVRKSNFLDTYAKKIVFQVEYIQKLGSLSYIDDVVRFSYNLAHICRQEVEKHIKRNTELLSSLSECFTMCIVSNYYGNLPLICKEFGIDCCFDIIVDSTLAGIRKPDPAIFSLALRQAKCEAENAFVIGDSYGNDIFPAHTIGCKTIWLKLKGWMDNNVDQQADFTIRELSEIRDIVLNQ